MDRCDSPIPFVLPGPSDVLADSGVARASSPLEDLGTSGFSELLEIVARDPVTRDLSSQLMGSYLQSDTNVGVSGTTAGDTSTPFVDPSASSVAAVLPEGRDSSSSSESPDAPMGQLVVDEGRSPASSVGHSVDNEAHAQEVTSPFASLPSDDASDPASPGHVVEEVVHPSSAVVASSSASGPAVIGAVPSVLEFPNLPPGN